jgi:hypothetical protein
VRPGEAPTRLSTGEATFRSEIILHDSFSDLINLLVKSRGELSQNLIEFRRLVSFYGLRAQFAYAIFQAPRPEMPRYKAA